MVPPVSDVRARKKENKRDAFIVLIRSTRQLLNEVLFDDTCLMLRHWSVAVNVRSLDGHVAQEYLVMVFKPKY
jgi:hypothetical protein